MNMPIQDRKYFIQRHNREEKELKEDIEGKGENHVIEGEAINTYAKLTQNDPLMQR